MWQRLLAVFRPKSPDLFNLVIEPAYAIKASARNPYFQGIERLARDTGFLGTFIVRQDGLLRPGCNDRLPTRHARLMLDVYPNPAAVEGRSVPNYDAPAAPRRVPRATLVMDDDTELFLWFDGRGPRVAGAALEAKRGA